MRCDEAVALMVDIGEGLAPDYAKHALEAHTAGCDRCRAALAEFRSSGAVLSQLKASSRLLNAPDDFDARLREAIAASGVAGTSRSWLFRYRLALSALAAAALAVVLGLYFQPGAAFKSGRTAQVEAPLILSSDMYEEASSVEELKNVADALFNGEFNQSELEAINGILAEDVDDQIAAMDDGTLGYFKILLDSQGGAGKSG